MRSTLKYRFFFAIGSIFSIGLVLGLYNILFSRDPYIIFSADESQWYFKILDTKGELHVLISKNLELLKDAKHPSDDVCYINAVWGDRQSFEYVCWKRDNPNRIVICYGTIHYSNANEYASGIQVEKYRPFPPNNHDPIWINNKLNPEYDGVLIHSSLSKLLVGAFTENIKIIDGERYRLI